MPFLGLILGFLRARWAAVAAATAAVPWVAGAIKGALIALKAAALVAFVLWIPLPGWLTDLPGRLGSLPSGFAWLLGIVQFPAGIAIVFGAYLLRFVLRMILRAIS